MIVSRTQYCNAYPVPPEPFCCFRTFTTTSSQRTQVAASEFRDFVIMEPPQKVKREEFYMNDVRLSRLPLPTLGDPIKIPSDLRVYFSANDSTLCNNVEERNLSKDVQGNFTVFDNDSLNGCHLEGVFTLIPRSQMPNSTTEDTFDILNELLRSSKYVNKRGDTRMPKFETDQQYVAFGRTPNRGGRGTRDNMTQLQKNKRAYLHVSNLFSAAEDIAKQYLNAAHLQAIKHVKTIVDWEGFLLCPNKRKRDDSSVERRSAIWPAIAFGKNVYFPSHVDNDFFWSLTIVVGENTYESNRVLNYFCFPEYGVAVPLRDSDIILFNPRVQHCISSRCNTDTDVINASLFLKTAIVGGNDNSLPLTGVQNLLLNHFES